MKFDFVIGNPPYQEQTVGENTTYAPQVYNKFMDEAFTIGKRVELIHPGRFLFDAGSTPKEWNQKMLHNKHFKILHYESDPKKFFPGIEITGGIAISYFDEQQDYGTIDVFTPFDELNSILQKVRSSKKFESMEQIVVTRTVYRLTDKLHADFPNASKQLSNGHAFDMSSNIFDRLPEVFFEKKPKTKHDYIRMLGRKDGNRAYMWIRRDYVKDVHNLDKFKVVMARGDGAAGTIGKPIPARIIGTPIVESPATGTTESFISIGAFNTEVEAQAALKYVKTQFARALISVLKVTQDINPDKFKYVPMQDFSSKSDIEWTKSIADIDKQLYKKYKLTKSEIEFIESHVKEMA